MFAAGLGARRLRANDRALRLQTGSHRPALHRLRARIAARTQRMRHT